jgi:ribosomal protein S12 methylthiotransferase
MHNKINLFTMGCSKNRVDSEIFIRQLTANGFEVSYEQPDGKFKYVVINTCGFINDAKEESIDLILHYAQEKAEGKVGKIVVFGCLSQRYKEDLKKEIPEVDAWFGKFELKTMLEYFKADYHCNLKPKRVLTTPSHYAYVKISEGCNRTCSFCAIPRITGGHQSRTIEDIVDECRSLVQNGVKEIILIAQDLSYYGIDIYQKPRLAELMEQIALVEGLKWLRIHYTYPAHFPMDILPVMAKYPNICKYLDIALQHISDPMLKAMRRNITQKETYGLIARFREQVPGLILRTTLLVGHPNESEQDFAELVEFVGKTRFDRLGVFTYSHEEDTYAYRNYTDNVPDNVKQERMSLLMEIQQQISFEINQQKIGNIIEVLIDRKEGDFYICRSQSDSPEVDGEVLVKSNSEIHIGSFINVKIYDADEFDLYALAVL